jgi:glycosyltransferase involved in cell wall biosynthesis
MGLPIPPNGWGGIEKVIWKHACELRKRGHEVEILNDRGPARLLVFDNYPKFDVVHVHQEWCFNELKARGIPFIFTSHMSGWKRNWSTVKTLLEGCSLAMPFEMMGKRLKCESGECWSIWNGADRKIFKPLEKVKGMSLAVGKDEPRKKFSEVIDLFYQSKGQVLALVGPGNDKYKGKPGVVVYPNLSEIEVADLMGRAETFYHLAEEEADCLVVREAATSGCKLVLSDYCRETLGEQNPSDYTWERAVDRLEEGYGYYLSEVKR